MRSDRGDRIGVAAFAARDIDQADARVSGTLAVDLVDRRSLAGIELMPGNPQADIVSVG